MRSDRNARRDPSGDHTGVTSPEGPLVSGAGRAPACVRTTHRSLGTKEPWSATVAVSANAIDAPSGDNASSVGVRTSRRSSAVGSARGSDADVIVAYLAMA